MNEPRTVAYEVNPTPVTNLLEAIGAIWDSVGEGLNDNEFTRLLQQLALPTEAGFDFLSFSDGMVMLSVPRQESANWYPEQGWISPEKEKIAQMIARKYDLTLVEPPDVTSACQTANTRHHLEFNGLWDTAIVAHPQYLKVRLIGTVSGSRLARGAWGPLGLARGLLKDLSALYPIQQPRGALMP